MEKYQFDTKEIKKAKRRFVKKEKYKYSIKKREVPFYVPHKWWRKDLKGLRPVERCLLISQHIWGENRPSARQLARELGVHRNTIKKALRKLEKWELK